MITSDDIPAPKPATEHVALAHDDFSSQAGLASFRRVRRG